MIRHANKFDMDEIIRMLIAYREKAPTKFLQETNDRPYIEGLLSNIITGAGFILLSVKEEEVTGMIIAAKHPNIWNPAVMQISEVAFWVDEAHRGGRTAHRLIHAYIQECEELQQTKQIEFFTISKMCNSPDLSYDRFGFEKLEETWIN